MDDIRSRMLADERRLRSEPELEPGDSNLIARFDELAGRFKRWNVRHFTPSEVVELGDNTLDVGYFPPPGELIANLAPTIRLADRIRSNWGGPVGVVSGYRPPFYNDFETGGAANSQHLMFRALDLQPVAEEFEFAQFRATVDPILEEQADRFDATGRGLYPPGFGSFIHVDVGHPFDPHRRWNAEHL